MRRAQQISDLKARARRLEAQGKTIIASMVIHRLRALMTLQIKSENRLDRRKRA